MSAATFAAEALRVFVLLVLAHAAVSKLAAFGGFRANLRDDFGVPAPLDALAAIAVVATEALLATAIAAGGGLARLGMIGALGVFMAFTALLAFRRARDGVVRCSCFGAVHRAVSGFDLARNVLIIVAIAFHVIAADLLPAWNPATGTAAAGLALLMTVSAVRFHEICTLLLVATDEPS